MEKQILHTYLYKAKQFYKSGNEEAAQEFCDMGILHLAVKRSEGYLSDDLIEEVSVDLWLERFWMFLENKNLLM